MAERVGFVLEVKPWPDEDLESMARRIAGAKAEGERLSGALGDPSANQDPACQ